MHRLEGSVGQPQFFGITIHQTNKGLLAPGNVIGQRNTGVITGLDNHTFVQVCHRNLIARFEEHYR
ncbi:Uncharacterised protein [Shigella flexneri]|nr:Uncharacterised protein [Shigella flexneri]